jgi:hypothetical protein
MFKLMLTLKLSGWIEVIKNVRMSTNMLRPSNELRAILRVLLKYLCTSFHCLTDCDTYEGRQFYFKTGKIIR